MPTSNVNAHDIQNISNCFSNGFKVSNRNPKTMQTQSKAQLIMGTRNLFAFFLLLTTLFHLVHASESSSSTPLTLFPITGTTILSSSQQEGFSSSEFIDNPDFIADNESHDTTNVKNDDSITLPEKKLVSNPHIVIPETSHVEFAGHTIGDSHRSSKSSQSFFASVDLDGDGQILKPEFPISSHK
jgi:hypothetical protein